MIQLKQFHDSTSRSSTFMNHHSDDMIASKSRHCYKANLLSKHAEDGETYTEPPKAQISEMEFRK